MFTLSRQYKGHSQDIKSVCSYHSTLYSCSRDGTVIIWQNPIQILTTHTSSTYVNSIAYLPPSLVYPEGLVVSGSNQKQIHIVDPRQPTEPLYILLGHENNICSLKTIPGTMDIISGSWDSTVKVWKDFKLFLNLVGHAAAVWDTLYLPETKRIVSCSADKTIKFWDSQTGKNTLTLTGHTDVVRALCLIPFVGFVSASNDATLRIWSTNGEALHTLFGHDSFIYTVSVLPTGEILSAGEDRCVKVFKGTECIQSIPLPCTSQWSCTALENGDFAVGGSDGILRVFTRDSSRTASAEELKEFQETIAQQAVPSNQIGDLDTSKVSGTEALSVPGTKEGQVKLFKSEKGQVDAYQWDSSVSKWIQIGRVVEAVGQHRKQVFNGQEYDYVFDVDIQEGAPPLKLPFNASENPYQAAQDFIYRNELNQDYLDQIAQFIIQNTSRVTLGAAPNQLPADPYTGASRYVPQESTKKVGSSVPIDLAHLSLPNKKFYLEKNQGNWIVSKSDVDIVSKLAFEWPDEYRFPGIDLLCFVTLTSPSSLELLSKETLKGVLKNLVISESMNKTSQINSMLEIRLLCNLFTCPSLEDWIDSGLVQMMDILGSASKAPPNKNLRLALSTLMHNVSVYMYLRPRPRWNSFLDTFISLILEFLCTDKDLEIHCRAWTAIKIIFLVKGEALQKERVKSLLHQDKNHFRDEKLNLVLTEIESFLS